MMSTRNRQHFFIMKLLLVFALCGVTCCLAGSTCSKDELRKCYQAPPGPGVPEDEQLEMYCKESKCYLEVYEKCGQSAFAGPFPVKGYRKVVNTFCDRSNPLRKKYLDNVKCIKSVTTEDDIERLVKICKLEDIVTDRYCRKIPKGFACVLNYIYRNCGKDAGDVFMIAGLPSFDPLDCLSTFDE